MGRIDEPDPVKIVIFYFLYTIITYFVVVLFGAPVLTSQFETLTLSLCVALLSGLPFLWRFIPTTDNLRKVLWNAQTHYEYFASCCFWGTLAGTWASAFFLVLDWDRPWQAWPIPCLIGAFVGDIVAFCFVFIPHRYFQSDLIAVSTSYCLDRSLSRSDGGAVKVSFN